MKLCYSLMSIILCLLLYTHAGAATISGRVINKTDSEHIPSNEQVVLAKYKDVEEVERYATDTDRDGRFVFKDISVDDGYDYLVIVRYKGVAYFSEWLRIDDGVSEPVTLPVFDITVDNKGIKIEKRHVIVDIENNYLSVVETIDVRNYGNTTYTGRNIVHGKRETIRFVLPEGAARLTFISGMVPGYVLKTRQGILDTRPIKPGKRSVSFSYKIPYPSPGGSLVVPIATVTEKFDLMFQAGAAQLRIEDDRLAGISAEDIGGKKYHRLIFNRIYEGASITIGISDIRWGNVYFKWGSLIVLFAAGAGLIIIEI